MNMTWKLHQQQSSNCLWQQWDISEKNTAVTFIWLLRYTIGISSKRWKNQNKICQRLQRSRENTRPKRSDILTSSAHFSDRKQRNYRSAYDTVKLFRGNPSDTIETIKHNWQIVLKGHTDVGLWKIVGICILFLMVFTLKLIKQMFVNNRRVLVWFWIYEPYFSKQRKRNTWIVVTFKEQVRYLI